MKRFLSRAFPRMGPTASISKDFGFIFALKNMPFVYYTVCLLHKSWKCVSNIVVFTQSRKRISTLVLKR